MRTSLVAGIVVVAALTGFGVGKILTPTQPEMSELPAPVAVAEPAPTPVATVEVPQCPAPVAAEPVAVQPARRKVRESPFFAMPAKTDRLSALKKSLKTFNHADRLVRTAIDAAESGNHKLAWSHLRRATSKNPDHAIAHLLGGVLAQLDGNPEQARAEYGRYLMAEPVGEFAPDVRQVLSNVLATKHVAAVASR